LAIGEAACNLHRTRFLCIVWLRLNSTLTVELKNIGMAAATCLHGVNAHVIVVRIQEFSIFEEVQL
jgi:hypothetical protein